MTIHQKWQRESTSLKVLSLILAVLLSPINGHGQSMCDRYEEYAIGPE
jgi:hypothetical protein